MIFMFVLFFVLFFFFFFFFFFQAEDGIRDADVTGVQTCALPISSCSRSSTCSAAAASADARFPLSCSRRCPALAGLFFAWARGRRRPQIGRASCRERV